MNSVIEIKGLCKSFGEVQAVKDLSFQVFGGELFAFLGVNGAGKSTTINILTGQSRQDAGSVSVFGKSPLDPENKRALGVVFQTSVLDKALSVRDNLLSRAALYGIIGDEAKKRLEELCRLFALNDIISRPLAKLSGGQKRRVDIARALIHHPKILILDEPTTGLDPQTRRLIWQVVTELRRNEGLTVLLTTHYMEEAADADRVVIIDSGKILAEGTPRELKTAYAKDYLTIYGISEDQVQKLDTGYEVIGEGYRIAFENTSMVTDLILKHPEMFFNYEVARGNMDDVFLAVTGKTLGREV